MILNLHGYGPSILEGTLLTLKVSFLSLFIAMLLGFTGAMFKLSSSKALNLIAQVYTTIIRGIPDLVLMLLIFFGGQVMINQVAPKLGYDAYIDVNPFIAGVLTIGFIFGAYMTETFRGAILAVSPGQMEAGYAFGMSRTKVFFRILFPQMMRHALPGFGNNFLVLIKSTALVSIIGLDDMVRKAAIASGSTRLPFTFYFAVAIIYLLITSCSGVILNMLDRKYSVGVVKG